MRKINRTLTAAGAVLALAGAGLGATLLPSRDDVVVAVLRSEGDQLRVERITMPSQESAEGLVAKLQGDPDVVAASIPQERTTLVSNDTRRNEQWALNRLQAEESWSLATGRGQVVAVLDTGVDATHPDLAGAVLPGYDVIGDSDGRVDPNGHGTHVAGIIAANANNTLGVAGLAPDARILPVRVLGRDGSGDDAGIADGVLWAADHGADIINLSLGGPDRDPVLAAAVAAVLERGVTVIAASGNDGAGANTVSYPGALPGVVAVGATTFGDRRALFSTSGSYVSLAAPGMSVLSTWPGGGYSYSSGTSMASPYAAATAALVAEEKGLSGRALAAALTSSATDAGAPGRDDLFGSGVVDPYAALTDGVARAPRSGGDLPDLTLPELTLPDLTRPVLPSPPDRSLPDRGELPPELGDPSVIPQLRAGSDLSMSAARNGSEVHVTGTLKASLRTSHVALGRRQVRVESLGAEWSSLSTVTTDPFGRVDVRVEVPAGSQVRLRFEGDSIAGPTSSAPRTP